MSPDFCAQIWSLPGAQRLLNEISLKLKDGISLWILLPETVLPDQFSARLEHHLGMQYCSNTGCLELGGRDYNDAIDVFRNEFPSLGEYRFLEEFVNAPELPDTLIIYGLEQRPKELIENWASGLARWAEACRSTGARRSLAIVTDARTVKGIHLPSPDIRLDYFFWMGIPSVLEFRMLCRTMSNGNGGEAHWRETMISSLAGSDLDLGAELWDVITDSQDAILDRLTAYARQRGWHEKNFRDTWKDWRPCPPGADVQLFRLIQSRNLELLSQGFTVYTPEYGEEIHSSILALLQRIDEIRHRMWRAQAALLLPQIDDLRRRVCDLITRRHGERWAYIDGQMLSSPLEMSKLKLALSRNFGSDSWEYHHLYPWVQDAWLIRNKLAHYEPVSFLEYMGQWRVSANVHQYLVPVKTGV